jgi:hypothetical protein
MSQPQPCTMADRLPTAHPSICPPRGAQVHQEQTEVPTEHRGVSHHREQLFCPHKTTAGSPAHPSPGVGDEAGCSSGCSCLAERGNKTSLVFRCLSGDRAASHSRFPSVPLQQPEWFLLLEQELPCREGDHWSPSLLQWAYETSCRKPFQSSRPSPMRA